MTAPMRVLFTGSRTYDDHTIVEVVIEGLVAQYDGALDLTVVHGGAPGLDTLVDRIANANPSPYLHIEAYPAAWAACDWVHLTVPCPRGRGHRRRMSRYTLNTASTDETYCPLAGLRRNQHMADLGADMLVAFVDKPLVNSRGTNDMVERAVRAGIDPIHVITTGGRP